MNVFCKPAATEVSLREFGREGFEREWTGNAEMVLHLFPVAVVEAWFVTHSAMRVSASVRPY